MNATSTPFGTDFFKNLIDTSLKALDDGTKMAYRMLWDASISLLKQYWIAVIVVLALVLVYSFLRALTGRWGLFGSVLYNYLYFGTLFVIGFIWGPEVFANDYFKIFLAILYATCFILVGRILRKIGVRRR